MNIEDINKLRALAVAADQPHSGVARDYLRQAVTSPRMLALLDLAERQLNGFQQRVQPWMLACFGEMIAGDREERNHRFLEEALELVQSTGCTASEAHQLVDYVYGRPVGEPAQEVGGVMVTLAALCLANSLDMHADAETELARIWTKVEAIRAKQAAKPKHSPLPATPPAIEAPQALSDDQIETIVRLCRELESDTTANLVAACLAAVQPAAAPAVQVQSIKTWQERIDLSGPVDPQRDDFIRSRDSEIADLRAALAAKPAVVPGESLPLPDLLWDAADPEEGPHGDGAADFAKNYAGGNMAPGDESEVTVLCATRVHSRKMYITVTDDEDNWLHWRWLDNPLPPDAAPSPAQAHPIDGPLSSRLRHGVECAPWVIDEVRKLESKVAQAQPVATNAAARVTDYGIEVLGGESIPAGGVAVTDWFPLKSVRRRDEALIEPEPVADAAPQSITVAKLKAIGKALTEKLSTDYLEDPDGDSSDYHAGKLGGIMALWREVEQHVTKPSDAQGDALTQQGKVAVPADKLTYDDCARFGLDVAAIRALAAKPAESA